MTTEGIYAQLHFDKYFLDDLAKNQGPSLCVEGWSIERNYPSQAETRTNR